MDIGLAPIIPAMKVLNLLCAHHHAFEGWFGSEDDFQAQLERGLVESAPRRHTARATARSARRPKFGRQAGPEARQEVANVPDPAAMQAAWLKMVRHVMANTEDVGERFTEEARRIHYGESEERGIRGQASAEQTQELLEEGIGVLPLPIPKALKGPIQ